jgi:hypothetical protein
MDQIFVNGIKSLCDVKGLERLEEVCAHNNVTLICHGSAARQIAKLQHGGEPNWTIFDAVPFPVTST